MCPRDSSTGCKCVPHLPGPFVHHRGFRRYYFRLGWVVYQAPPPGLLHVYDSSASERQTLDAVHLNHQLPAGPDLNHGLIGHWAGPHRCRRPQRSRHTGYVLDEWGLSLRICQVSRLCSKSGVLVALCPLLPICHLLTFISSLAMGELLVVAVSCSSYVALQGHLCSAVHVHPWVGIHNLCGCLDLLPVPH